MVRVVILCLDLIKGKKGYLIPCFKGECHHAGDFSYIKKKRERETEARSSKHIILWKGSHKDIYSTVLQILSLYYSDVWNEMQYMYW